MRRSIKWALISNFLSSLSACLGVSCCGAEAYRESDGSTRASSSLPPRRVLMRISTKTWVYVSRSQQGSSSTSHQVQQPCCYVLCIDISLGH